MQRWSVHTVINDDTAGNIAGNDGVAFQFQQGDGIAFLASYPFTSRELVYGDPPYLHHTRRRATRYPCEMDDEEHAALLETIQALPCRVMISGYWSELYAQALKDWTAISFQAMTRSGRTATEWLWFNFSEVVALHDYR
jgi:site-specific DNA-adenine methylase